MYAACLLLALTASGQAAAQNPATVQQATTFANTLAPRSAAQVVNPAAVNATVWGNSTATPTTIPTNLGGFSTPTTSSATYASARGSSLAALGTQAMIDCANYVPGPGSSPAQTQACAAVNFLTNQCLTPTTAQGAVLAHVGASQVVTGNCSGTYGEASHTFNLQNQITSTDPVFTVVNNLGATAPATVSSVCSPQTVTTAPAQFTTNLCTKETDTTGETCSQYLDATVTTSRTAARRTETCQAGTLVGDFCQSTSTGAAQPSYVCPPGQTLQGTQCNGANVTTPAIIASYTCPPGQTLAGSVCVDQINTDDGAAGTSYSCAPGATLFGTTCSSTATGNATYPPGQFCQDGYGRIPPIWSISNNVCTIQWSSDQQPETKAADQTTGCPGLPDFLPVVGGIQINTIGAYRNADCKFVTHTGDRSNSYCPLPDPAKYILEDQTGPAPVPGYAYTSTTVCSYKPASHYSCPPGETIDSNNQCHGGTTTTAIVTNFFCPTGGAYVNGQCVTTTEASAAVTYSCPPGENVSGTRCTKTTTTTTAATPVYSCGAGYTLSGTTCSEPGNTIPAAVTYSCPPGATLSGNMCVTTVTEPATVQYSCIDGSAPIAGICVIKSLETAWTDTCGQYERSAGSWLPHP